MSGEDSGMATLAETIAAVRRDLSEAQEAGMGQGIRFRAGPVELEFELGVSKTGGMGGGVKLYVLTVDGKR